MSTQTGADLYVDDLIEPDWQDGVAPPLGLFCRSVQRKLPMIRFAAHKEDRHHTGQRYKLYAYFDGDPMTIGRVGYSPSGGREGTSVYIVGHPKIVNQKYSGGASSKEATRQNMEAAVSVASRFFKPVKPQWFGRVMAKDALSLLLTSHNAARAKWNTEMNDLFGYKIRSFFDTNKDLPSLLRHLVETNYEFPDTAFGETLHDLYKREVAHMSAKTVEGFDEKAGDWYIVFFKKMKDDKTYAVQLRMLVSGPPDTWGQSFNLDEEAWIMDVDELSAPVQEKLALLAMVPDQHVVDGVGVRLREHCYYINV